MTEKIEYSPEAYEENNIGEYRERFPVETEKLSDEQLFAAVMDTEDDMDDDQWKGIFIALSAIA